MKQQADQAEATSFPDLISSKLNTVHEAFKDWPSKDTMATTYAYPMKLYKEDGELVHTDIDFQLMLEFKKNDSQQVVGLIYVKNGNPRRSVVGLKVKNLWEETKKNCKWIHKNEERYGGYEMRLITTIASRERHWVIWLSHPDAETKDFFFIAHEKEDCCKWHPKRPYDAEEYQRFLDGEDEPEEMDD